MTSIHDVAAKITNHFQSGITTMKLQKLVYFAQGWSFALLGHQLFEEDFRAWTNGPVAYDLFDRHRRQYLVGDWKWGDENELSPEEHVVVDAVLKNFGALSGPQLSELTHRPGTPWSKVRTEHGVPEGEACNITVPKPAIQEFFTRAN